MYLDIKIKQGYPIYLSKESFEYRMESLLIESEDISHFVYIKDFDRFMYSKRVM